MPGTICSMEIVCIMTNRSFFPFSRSGWRHPAYRLLRVIPALVLSVALGTAAPSVADQTLSESPCIIVLHGLGRSAVSMKAVQWRLEEEGYAVVNNSYSWLGNSIEEIAPLAIDESLSDCRELGKTRIGFVTHSMGGILLRQYLQEEFIAGLQRVVMLAPPNQGSVMAEQLLDNELLEPLLPKPAHQLGIGENSLPRQLGPVNFELGVIAGSDTRALMSPGLENLANDGTVAVDETRVEGMQDFIVLSVDHSFLMWREVVLDQVVWFLREGRFNQEPPNSGLQ